MKKRDIIFLDVDGVLNGRWEVFTLQERNYKLGEKYPEKYFLDATEYHIKVLDELCRQNVNIRIVISSTWRFMGSKDWFSEEFKRLGSGIAYKRIIGETCYLKPNDVNVENFQEKRRGCEIQVWLQKHIDLWKTFVIIDDNSDMGHLMANFYKIDNDIGIHKLDIPHILSLFEEQNEKILKIFINNSRLEVIEGA